MDWTKEKQYDVLLRFFNDCVRFWERELKTDRDLDKEPYINALNEIPKHNPYIPNGMEFDKDVREEFIKHRYMDTYGRNWENFYRKEDE